MTERTRVASRKAAAQAEIYSSERKAEFILTNATTVADYEQALREVRQLGLDPKKIEHRRPWRRRAEPGSPK